MSWKASLLQEPPLNDAEVRKPWKAQWDDWNQAGCRWLGPSIADPGSQSPNPTAFLVVVVIIIHQSINAHIQGTEPLKAVILLVTRAGSNLSSSQELVKEECLQDSFRLVEISTPNVILMFVWEGSLWLCDVTQVPPSVWSTRSGSHLSGGVFHITFYHLRSNWKHQQGLKWGPLAFQGCCLGACRESEHRNLRIIEC